MFKLATILTFLISTTPMKFAPPVAAINQSSEVANDLSLDGADTSKLQASAPKLNSEVLQLAVKAYNHANDNGKVKKPILTVIDYSLPSSKARMWVFDVASDTLLYKTYVAHGKNSGNLYAKSFSNRPQSKASSLGTYVTKDTYIGSKGIALHLQGLEKKFNSNAYRRAVVMHGAWYVDKQFIKQNGRAGRSWGCPAVGKKLAKPIINTIKNGSVIFAYYPDSDYLSNSSYLT